MQNYLDIALEAARSEGADWADIRIVATRREGVFTQDGELGALNQSDDLGYGIRVLAGGAWGFAASDRMNGEELVQTARLAVRIAKASAKLNSEQVQLAAEPAWRDIWQTPLQIDPFTISIEEKLELLFAADEILRRDPRIKRANGKIGLLREHQWHANSEGACIEQILTRTSAGISVVAIEDGNQQIRGYPMSHGGGNCTAGWEYVLGLDLVGNAERVREEALALLKAPACPSGRYDLILLPRQLVLQIHESVGHATELDRVLGYEANYAGTSFATTEKMGKFQYGSSIVNLVADGTVPGGLATQGYDDDGVRQGRWHIVQDGILQAYMTNRELAHRIGEKASRGCNRAEGWSNLPITRINNLSLMPGDSSLEELIAGVDDGVMMDCNKSWSIDQRRLNFQFGCEIGWRIKGGKLAGLVQNPSYQGITPEFWNACDGIAGPEEWELIGVANCGKGQPAQTAEMSHGSAPARFRQIELGI